MEGWSGALQGQQSDRRERASETSPGDWAGRAQLGVRDLGLSGDTHGSQEVPQVDACVARGETWPRIGCRERGPVVCGWCVPQGGPRAQVTPRVGTEGTELDVRPRCKVLAAERSRS